MPSSSFAGSFSTPKLNVAIDTGNPFLNVTVDGFLKIGIVAATKSLAEDAYYIIKGGNFSTPKIKHASWDSCRGLKSTAAYWIMVEEDVQGRRLLGFVCAVLHILRISHTECAGTVAGLYVGMEYGMERVRGTRDWKNAMLGGALTGALISAASNKHKDNIVIDAITGGAIATASTFLNYLI
ncbi:hypothetical protein SADUNF_Sadunf16G0131000 [Salix dunnii]|uniref:Uncharacterized protein n=1 Tax=Salix dunnii TaxID=1413687 RepID=A0A835J9I3_9ROSI|nr:hypothetical protein SADUNF_Sadunf16G0131000 [Salix dunnii]